MTTQKRGLLLGIGLIALGIVFLIAQLVGGIGDALILLLVGGGFIFAYLSRNQYGLLIPGGILVGLGIGTLLERMLSPFAEFETLGLGLGFLLIYLIDLLRQGHTSWWPLAPGTVLILVGLVEGSPQFQEWLTVGWPAILILIGLLLLIRTLSKNRSPDL